MNEQLGASDVIGLLLTLHPSSVVRKPEYRNLPSVARCSSDTISIQKSVSIELRGKRRRPISARGS